MPIPTNTSPATATTLVVDVLNTTIAADVALAPDGTGFTSTCRGSNPQRFALWYKYTVPTGIKYISLGIVCVPASPTPDYIPVCNIWTETAPGVYTQYTDGVSNNYCSVTFRSNTAGFINSFLVVVTPGTTYYLQVADSTVSGTVDSDLSVKVTHAPAGTLSAGSVMIPDELGPYPTAVISSETDSIVGYTAYGINWAGEHFSVIQRGGWILNQVINTLTINCFDPPPTFTLISNIDLATWADVSTGIRDSCSDQVSKHYVLTKKAGIYYLHKIDAVTGVKDATYTLPNTANSLVGVCAASGIAYYIDNVNLSAVHRFDVTNNIPLSDFLADDGLARADGFVLPNGTVILVTFDATTDWKFYDSDGNVTSTFVNRDYHRASLDNNLTGVWFWENTQTTFHHVGMTTLNVNDEEIIINAVIGTSGGPKGNFGGIVFGFSDSCPILVYPMTAAEVTAKSGIYYLNPSKTHDTYYSETKKIPNPTIRTALIGE